MNTIKLPKEIIEVFQPLAAICHKKELDSDCFSGDINVNSTGERSFAYQSDGRMLIKLDITKHTGSLHGHFSINRNKLLSIKPSKIPKEAIFELEDMENPTVFEKYEACMARPKEHSPCLIGREHTSILSLVDGISSLEYTLGGSKSPSWFRSSGKLLIEVFVMPIRIGKPT
jgi:hypothetical protein